MQLDPYDWIIVSSYLVAVLFTGFAFSDNKSIVSDKLDFILAGRKITLPLFVATLVATWYGSILGVGEFVYNAGITAWLTLGLPYYIAAIFFAFFLSGKIRSKGAETIPEQIASKFGKNAGIIASLVVLVITIPAAYISMLGTLTSSLTGLSDSISILLVTFISLVYIYYGGYRSDVYANVVQLILMYLGFVLLVYFTIDNFGSPGTMINDLPTYATDPLEKNSIQFILVWYIIAFQTFVDPSFHQRCASAVDAKTAKEGILVSVFLWLIFDMMTLLAGLYALAYIDISDPLDTYLVLGENVLPHLAKGIFVAALFATIMSTLSSYGFLSAITIGNDIISKISNKYSSKTNIRIGLVLTGILGVLISVFEPSVIQIFYKTASISIPGLLFPLIISYSEKYSLKASHAITIILLSSIMSSIWMLLGTFLSETDMGLVFTNIEPMLIGLLISFVLSLFFIVIKSQKNL